MYALRPLSDLAKFELIQDFMVVLITCINEEDPIKNEGARLLTTVTLIFQTLKGWGNIVVSGLIWFKFKLIQAFMHALVSCKNEEVPIKNEGVRVVTTFLPL